VIIIQLGIPKIFWSLIKERLEIRRI